MCIKSHISAANGELILKDHAFDPIVSTPALAASEITSQPRSPTAESDDFLTFHVLRSLLESITSPSSCRASKSHPLLPGNPPQICRKMPHRSFATQSTLLAERTRPFSNLGSRCRDTVRGTPFGHTVRRWLEHTARQWLGHRPGRLECR